MKTSTFILSVSILLFSFTSIKCQQNASGGNQMVMKSEIRKAVCVMMPTKGNTVTGTITFTQTDKGIKVVANIHGLKKGKHGIHIHECGDCTSDDGTSAGGHFNPDHKMHGGPANSMRHEGDLGNIIADESGNAHLELTDNMLSFEGAHSIIGRSVIIHESEDDYKTQPTGNSGARVACGVIGISK